MELIRVLVIDDSAFMRKMISDILSTDHRIKVVGTARNGEDGLMKIQDLSPDVITLDIEMPVMDGITTLQKIMDTNPIPVVMVSSVTSKGATKTLQAISHGAVDFITKPSGSISLDINDIKQEIILKVLTASQAKVKKSNRKITNERTEVHSQSYSNSIVVIGTSTGGPRALQQVLTEIPSDFQAPILVVQHMPANFTKSLADRLNSVAQIHVKEASNGDIIRSGTAYIAPGSFHMNVRRAGTALTIELTQDKPVRGHRPAVDVLFHSVSKLQKINKLAVILTGMGKDGSAGLKELKREDPDTIIIAEAEESSIVYGMPYAAVKTGLVNYVSHLDKVAQGIIDIVNKSGRS